jgi:hypothetical protein
MNGITAWVRAHRKALVAVLGAAVSFAVAQGWTGSPWVTLLIGLAAALGVGAVPNEQTPVAVPRPVVPPPPRRPQGM